MAGSGPIDGKTLAQRTLAGDRRALARLITRVEARAPDLSETMAVLHGSGRHAWCVGITGPPGAGKSTLTDRLIEAYRAQDLTVGVVAVDPSSPFSGGAVLGDRVRMQRHTSDPGVYIRSLATRGRHGGVSRATRDVRSVMDAAGFDVLLLETVGVGQTELDIMEIADTTVVIMVPEAGDAVQTLKAGLLEIADIFVVNKADREGSDRMRADLRTLIMMRGDREGWETPILATVATRGEGVDELIRAVADHRDFAQTHDPPHRRRRRAALREILLERVHAHLDEWMAEDDAVGAVVKRLEAGEVDPYTAADEIARLVKTRDPFAV